MRLRDCGGADRGCQLRLHGLIERRPKSQRYRLTLFGLKATLLYARVYHRLLRPGFSKLADARRAESSPLGKAFATFQQQLDGYAAQKAAA